MTSRYQLLVKERPSGYGLTHLHLRWTLK